MKKPNTKEIIDKHINSENYYDDHMYVTNSMLKVLLEKSPKHLEHYSKSPMHESAAMKFGTAFHVYVLENDKFEKEYAIEPDVDKRTTLGKTTMAKFNEKNAGKIPLSKKDYETILSMDEVIISNKNSNLIIDGVKEHIYLWENLSLDMKCKCKLDVVNFKDNYIVDIKTTYNASPKVFEETIIKSRYHMQAAFYLDALQMEDYYIFAIEKSAPYGLCVYKMGKSIIEEGRKEYVKGLHIMKEIWDTNISKDYNNEQIKTVSL